MTLEEMRKMRKAAYQKKVKKYIEHVGTAEVRQPKPKAKAKPVTLRSKAQKFVKQHLPELHGYRQQVKSAKKKWKGFWAMKPRETPITYGGAGGRGSQMKRALKGK